MKYLNLFKPAVIVLIFTVALISASCQMEEQKTYTDQEAQTLLDNSAALWSGGNIDLVDQIYQENCLRHNADLNEQKGVGEIKGFVNWVYGSYPDFKVSFNETMMLKDKIIIMWSAHATNTGPLDNGVPATGKQISLNGVNVLNVVNGKVSEEWTYFNQLPIFQQLGFTMTPPSMQKTTQMKKEEKTKSKSVE